MVFCYVIIHITYMQCKVAIWRVIKCATLMGNCVIGKVCRFIKSVFTRKFRTQHNVLVHSSDYLCNKNPQYLSLLKRIKIQRIQLIKNSFIMAYIQRRLDTLYVLLKITFCFLVITSSITAIFSQSSHYIDYYSARKG